MYVITLEEIKAAQNKLAEMIAAFESCEETSYLFPETEIVLNPGEHYAGLIIGHDGAKSHHLILMPDDKDSINWKDATEWAKSIGGSLPTRREQSLLFANLKGQFKDSWYWSCEQHASDSSCAWYQYFGNGYQTYRHKFRELRARAVRRLVI